MIAAMRQLELLGRAADLEKALFALQRMRLAEVVPTTEDPDAPQEPVVHALQRTLALLATLSDLNPTQRPAADPTSPPTAATNRGAASPLLDVALLDALEPQVATLSEQAEELTTEQTALRHQVNVLERLETLIPELAHLTDDELRLLDLSSIAVVLDDPDGRVVDALRVQLRDQLGDRHLLVVTDPHTDPHTDVPTADRTKDRSRRIKNRTKDRGGIGAGAQSTSPVTATGCLLVVPHADLDAVEALLGSDRIARLAVPEHYAGRSLHSTVVGMRERLTQIPAELDDVHAQLSALLFGHAGALRRLEHQLRALLERDVAGRAARSTDRTFALRVWVPADSIERIAAELGTALDQAVVVVPVEDRDVIGDPPTLLRHRRAWRPFGNLVTFLSWPTPGGIDPTGMMAIALPFLFGVMVGDVVYGLLLVLIGWGLRARTTEGTFQRDAAHVLMIGGAWATLFGILFGEALGSLGNKLGMPALWFYRGGPDALEPLLIFALALGAVHITLGLLLGLWQAIIHRHRHQILERAGTLLFLIGLFAIAGVVASALPDGLLTPAVVAICIGMVIASVSHGALGLLLGPLELLGAVGNILSYLRVAAVGLASVYLANVANELAATAPLLLGILIAAFFHTLNLALAAFSPTVQALRLHYVEFFSKFHDGTGRPFQPLGSNLHPDLDPDLDPDLPVSEFALTPAHPGSARRDSRDTTTPTTSTADPVTTSPDGDEPTAAATATTTQPTAPTTGAANERETSWKQA